MIAPQISIPVTDNCNLKCKYCYFRAGDADKKACQSKEEIKCYVDAYLKRLSAFQIRNKENIVDVSIAGGGEPTVAFDEFQYTVLYCEEAFKKYGLIPKFHTRSAMSKVVKIKEWQYDGMYLLSRVVTAQML
jgi:hypothetical protein